VYVNGVKIATASDSGNFQGEVAEGKLEIYAELSLPSAVDRSVPKQIYVAAASSLTITGIAVGDTIDLVGVSVKAIADVTATNWNLAEVTLGAAATLANYLDAAADQDGSTAAGVVEWFYFGGDTYIVVSNDTGATGFTAGTDVAIKLTGTLDIDGSSITSEVITIAS